jgi:hypothetical protein
MESLKEEEGSLGEGTPERRKSKRRAAAAMVACREVRLRWSGSHRERKVRSRGGRMAFAIRAWMDEDEWGVFREIDTADWRRVSENWVWCMEVNQ